MKYLLSLTVTILIHFSTPNLSIAQSTEKLPLANSEYFKTQNKHILKTNPISPLFGRLSFSYEQLIATRRSIEFKFGYTINQKDDTHTTDGFLIGIGYKYFISPLLSKRKSRTVQIVQGFYIQPELLLGFFNKNVYYDSSPLFRFTPSPPILSPAEKQKKDFQVLMSNFGLQKVIGKRIILDLYTGIGFGRDSIKQYGNSTNTFHNLIKFKPEGQWSIAMNIGIRTGIWF